MGNKIEVEFKFELFNSDKLIIKLNQIADFKGEESQKDTYYNAPHRNFLSVSPIKEWLRIRETNGKTKVNYKNFHHTSEYNAVSCDEFETNVEDKEVIKRIFESLNFSEMIVLEKVRKNWEYKNVIISVDEVRGLGSFIEVEAGDGFESIEDAKKQLQIVIKEIGAEVGNQLFKGYPHLLMEKNGLK